MEEQFKVILFSTDTEDTYDIMSSITQNPEGWINEGTEGTSQECYAHVTQRIESPIANRKMSVGPMMGQGMMGRPMMGQGTMGQG